MPSNTIVALGKVTVAASGTPQRITSTSTHVNSVTIQALPTNTGKIYVMERSNGVIATFVGVAAVIAIPTDNIIPSFSIAVSGAGNPINIADLYLDAENNGEGAIVTGLVR